VHSGIKLGNIGLSSFGKLRKTTGRLSCVCLPSAGSGRQTAQEDKRLRKTAAVQEDNRLRKTASGLRKTASGLRKTNSSLVSRFDRLSMTLTELAAAKEH